MNDDFKDSPESFHDSFEDTLDDNDNDKDYDITNEKPDDKTNSKKGHYCSMGHPKIFCETIELYDEHFRENHQDICKGSLISKDPFAFS